MIKFNVATNWQEDFLLKIKKGSIAELYGKLNDDFIGGARPSSCTPYISRKKISAYIGNVHKNGLEFNYLLNSTCLDNREITKEGYYEIRTLLDWLGNIGVDSVTVAIPYLLELIKKQYPQFKICVSAQANVDTVKRAARWEDLGADEITLSFINVNRDFSLLREIKNNIKCKLNVIANLDCLYHCPFYEYHSNLSSHASQSCHHNKGFLVDYCYLRCIYQRFKNPVEFIRSPWIRPEDIHYYEDIGIDRIKLLNRGMTTEALIRVVDAYASRRYDGNLLDLFSDPSKNITNQKGLLFHKIKLFFRPSLVNIFKLFKMMNSMRELLSKRGVYIDNRALDGFIDYFIKGECSLKTCKECNYCEEVSKRVVKIDHGYQREVVEKYGEYLNAILSGGIFK